MEEQTIKNRLEEALQIRGMKQVDLVERTGIKKSSINGWVKNRYQPKHHAVYLLAQALDVSEMWLAGYDAPMVRAADRDRCQIEGLNFFMPIISITAVHIHTPHDERSRWAAAKPPTI